jgi:hypothetical protein
MSQLNQIAEITQLPKGYKRDLLSEFDNEVRTAWVRLSAKAHAGGDHAPDLAVQASAVLLTVAASFLLKTSERGANGISPENFDDLCRGAVRWVQMRETRTRT